MDKKLNLLRAAAEVFARDGFDESSVDEIVMTAGVAKGTFYYYYKSKEDLFISIISSGADRLSEQMEIESNKYSDPVEKVEAILTSQYQYFEDNRDICKMLLSEIWRFESKWQQKYVTKRNQYINALKNAIELGQKQKIFDRKNDASTCAIAIFVMVAISALDHATAHEKNIDKTVATITKLAINGLV